MKSTVTASAALAALALCFAPARAADPARLAAAERLLQQGVYAQGPQTLVRARAEFQSLSAAEPKSASLHYWVALADWRLVPRLGTDRAQAERTCKDGLERADRALSLDPKLAEAIALRASLQGLSLQFDPSSAMTLGQDMEQGMRRATSLAPKNPRVRLLDGINTLHKPEFVGGGADRALLKFREALDLFAAESTADSSAARWGREDAAIWAGRSAFALKDYETARGYYAAALKINPANGWVRGSLIPELEKAAAEAGAGHADSTAAGKP